MNWANQTIWTGDNLPILLGMNSESVDLIYLDPPFNSNHNYSAPIGSEAAGVAFKDTWGLDDIDICWLDLIEVKHPAIHRVVNAAMSKSDKAYLIYMAPRLMELLRVLKSSGTIYLHCDPTMSHYLKLLMDAVFGRKNFRNEILWCYTGPSGSRKNFPSKHDTIFRYSKSAEWVFNADDIRIPYTRLSTQHSDPEKTTGIGGKLTKDNVQEYVDKGKIPESWWSDISPVGRIKKERVGYPTQKPLALLRRIIKASSNEGDVVLDPFCGCATTCVAAEQLSREWVGIDLSSLAVSLVKKRITEIIGPLIYTGVNRTDIPRRTDLGPGSNRVHKDAKKILYGEQGGECNGCGTHFEQQHFEVDHIVARKSGGSNVIGNLQLLCGNCNRIKGDRGMEYLILRLRESEYGKFKWGKQPQPTTLK